MTDPSEAPPERSPRSKSSPETAATSWPAFQVERRSFAQLHRDPRNARKHSPDQVRQIALAMREWGWTIPILVDEADLIIAGHGRLDAAELNRAELPDDPRWSEAVAPVIVARGWSAAQKRAYALADNQIALNAEWDKAILRDDFFMLPDMGLDLSLTGFAADFIEDLVDGPKAPGEFPEHDENIAIDHQCPRCGYRWSGDRSVVADIAA